EPTTDRSSRRNTPTVDLYLYDIREDLEQREVMWESVRDDSGFVTERRPPARRFKLSYLVTAWTQRPEDEHRLLSSLLSCFLRNQTMPVDVITGSLVGARLPITLSIALPPPQDRSISDVWSAMGGELKASLDLVVNAPFEIKLAVPAGPPVLEEPRFTYAQPDGETEDSAVSAARSGKGRRVADPCASSPRADRGTRACGRRAPPHDGSGNRRPLSRALYFASSRRPVTRGEVRSAATRCRRGTGTRRHRSHRRCSGTRGRGSSLASPGSQLSSRRDRRRVTADCHGTGCRCALSAAVWLPPGRSLSSH